MSATLLDRLVGWINPHAGLSRHFARQRLERAYEAAAPRDTWRPRRAGASANADHQADAATLRAKARSLVQNVPYVQAGIKHLVDSTIGTGITPRSTSKREGTRTRLDELHLEWMHQCDADGRLDFHGLVAAAYRAMEVDGEVLVRLRPRRPDDGLAVPLQLQVLEIDWLATSKTGRNGGNDIVNGIEYGPTGRVAAYWLWASHPGDTGTTQRLKTEARRVEAANIIHLYDPERPGQGRGFTRLASVITLTRDLRLYDDAELARKNLESRLSVIASGDPTAMANPALGASAADPAGANATGNLGELASGSITAVPAGMNITAIEPKAAPGYAEYVRHQLHLIAVGIGVPYEALTGDMSQVNFSSARVRLLDFRRQVDGTRWRVLIPRLLVPLWRAFVDAAVLQGAIPRPEYAVDFAVPKWDYVNPEQDVQADALALSEGLVTLSELLRQRGYDPEQVMTEYARDVERLRELGLLDVLLFKQKGKVPGEAPEKSSQLSGT